MSSLYCIVMLLNFVITYQLLNNYNYHNYRYKYINKNHNNNHIKNNNNYNKQLLFQLNIKKTSSPVTATTIIPEFSRIINIQQIPKLKPVLCRLLANNEEKLKLSIRLDIPILIYFASNVTLSRRDDRSIIVNGQFEAHLKSGIPLKLLIIFLLYDIIHIYIYKYIYIEITLLLFINVMI